MRYDSNPPKAKVPRSNRGGCASPFKDLEEKSAGSLHGVSAECPRNGFSGRSGEHVDPDEPAEADVGIVSVYDGRTHLGDLWMRRGSVEARLPGGRSIGVYLDRPAARSALWAASKA